MYGAALAPLGYARSGDNGSIWGGQVVVTQRVDGGGATAGDGAPISLAVPTRRSAGAFHAAALASA